MKIDLSKFKNCSGPKGPIRTIELRELTGADSIAAADRTAVPGGNSTMVMFNIQHRNAMIADAIVEVNGQAVITPYVEWQQWNLRTQELVIAAFDHLNSVSSKEMDDFLVSIGAKEAPKAKPDATPEGKPAEQPAPAS